MNKKIQLVAAIALLFQMGVALAGSPQDADRLGKDLTTLGGEKAANKDASIPAWTGVKEADVEARNQNPHTVSKNCSSPRSD